MSSGPASLTSGAHIRDRQHTLLAVTHHTYVTAPKGLSFTRSLRALSGSVAQTIFPGIDQAAYQESCPAPFFLHSYYKLLSRFLCVDDGITRPETTGHRTTASECNRTTSSSSKLTREIRNFESSQTCPRCLSQTQSWFNTNKQNQHYELHTSELIRRESRNRSK